MKQAKVIGGGFSIAPGFNVGIVLVVLGLYFLAKDLGLISSDISLWPAVLLALGAYMISKSFRR